MMFNKKVRIGLSFGIVAVLLVWLTVSGFNDNMQYYVHIKEVKSMGQESYHKGLRVKGFLVEGSLEKVDHSLESRFIIEEDGEQMAVRYTKELPDTFKDGAEVLVEGNYTAEGYFDAKVLMAKCPSKYEGATDYSDLGADYSNSN